ncbi:FAD/NAD-binding domain-containing protein [Fomitiporia mediterranea MF3/22]|uniref:FAD/NAD-binding domain-containing protein n=1 Tax=Fomitiporia mediterranea (strain MF3/22) TaxID=694068 RepID=UPI00044084A5|nr:FAD/NAD-binding domain-containing protein [Fomitiporia mediterranea MF3/22]EJC99420.1 FAD/NAD-binding domain-containing protein [Fomitiporia mediterranea MF3/22]
MQNVIVLGGSYAGARVAHLLGQGLGNKFRVIMIDRNSHANRTDLYVFPRLAVLPGHEHKAFIPYKGIYHPVTAANPVPPPTHHLILQARIIGFTQHDVTIDRMFPNLGIHSPVIPYKYAVYALGNRLPAPIDLWFEDEDAVGAQLKVDKRGETQAAGGNERKPYGGSKQEGTQWLRRCQERIRDAGSILCVGGGALGIQFATDIKSLYPAKHVALLHSRHRLLPRFDYDLHCEVLKTLEDLRIDLVLGERLDLASTRPEAVKVNEQGQRVVRTVKGREVAADLLLLCTGQIPNTGFLAAMSPQSVDPVTKLAYVLPTMQLGIIPPASESDEFLESSKGTSLVSELDLSQLRIDEESESAVVADEGLVGEAQVEEVEEVVLEQLPETPYPHIFVIGDAADAFGAIKAGHTAYWQAEVAARNIIRLARREETEAEDKVNDGSEPRAAEEEYEDEASVGMTESLELESYNPGPPAIKVSLGIGQTSAYQINGVIGRKDTTEADDLDAPLAWAFFGMQDMKPEDLYS